MDWINAKLNPPQKIGWYEIKTPHGEYKAPVSNTLSGKLVWIVPDESIITHYKPINKTNDDNR